MNAKSMVLVMVYFECQIHLYINKHLLQINIKHRKLNIILSICTRISIEGCNIDTMR